jgi:hypothetical protein
MLYVGHKDFKKEFEKYKHVHKDIADNHREIQEYRHKFKLISEEIKSKLNKTDVVEY